MPVVWDNKSEAFRLKKDGKLWPECLTDTEVIEDVKHHEKYSQLYPVSLPLILAEAKKRGLM